MLWVNIAEELWLKTNKSGEIAAKSLKKKTVLPCLFRINLLHKRKTREYIRKKKWKKRVGVKRCLEREGEELDIDEDPFYARVVGVVVVGVE